MLRTKEQETHLILHEHDDDDDNDDDVNFLFYAVGYSWTRKGDLLQ
jgi:hypothetical protein